MSDRFDSIPALIEQTIRILNRMVDRLDAFEAEIVPKIGRSTEAAMIPARILENGYTAAETLFLRISQAFENSLAPERWHADLLEKMTIEIPKTRPRVVGDETYRKLLELLRFRHFARYYVELDYDWRKIDLLVTYFREVVPLLIADLTDFSSKLAYALKPPGE